MVRVLSVFLLVPCMLYGQRSRDIPSEGTPGMAKFVMYRESAPELKNKGAAITLDGLFLTTLWNASWYTYESRPGRFVFGLEEYPGNTIDIFLREKEICYVRVRVFNDTGTLSLMLEEVEESTARAAFETGRLRNLGSFNPQQDSLRVLRTGLNWAAPDAFQLGLQLGLGYGFSDVPMVILVNGSTSDLSSGGGFLFGLSGSYRFTRNIDLSCGIAVQSSGLMPVVSNATASFDRLVIDLTCRYGIPFAKRLRFSFGPGVSFANVPNLTADLTKLQNGVRMDFNYKSATGYHGMAELAFFARSLCLSMAMKYTGIIYELDEARVNGTVLPPDDPDLGLFRKMNGDGLYICWGVAYCF